MVTSSAKARFLCTFDPANYFIVGIKQSTDALYANSGWTWENGTAESVLPAPWQIDEPNDGYGGNSVEYGNENCALVPCNNLIGAGGINDCSCSQTMKLACETKSK
jgi:hypothetical protein